MALALGSSCWVASGSASCWDCCVPPEGPDVPGSRLPRAVGSQGRRLLSPLPWVFSRLYALLPLVLAQVALGLCARARVLVTRVAWASPWVLRGSPG